MKPEELRIGNIVQDHNGFQMQVVGIFEDEILLDFEGNEGDVWQFSKKEMELLQGVPLTESWLLNYGFIEEDGFWIKGEIVLIEFEGCFALDAVDVSCPPKLPHIHQLQNLYYALTNEELTPKTK